MVLSSLSIGLRLGTTFANSMVMFEWQAPQAQMPPNPREAANDANYPTLQQLFVDADGRTSVLVIESNVLQGQFIQSALEARGLRVTRVADHRLALPALTRRHYDVVVANLHTPRGSLDALAAVMDCLEHRPKLVVTAPHETARLRRIAKTYRATELAMPYSSRDLERALLA